MGFLVQAAVQVFLTTVVIGALKHTGVVRLDPERITDSRARAIFRQAVDFGENIAIRGERLYVEITKPVRDRLN